MNELGISFWLYLGLALVLAEVILPGLISVFVGMGAFTVALFLHFNWIESVSSQVIAWLSASLVYIFSLRLVVMRYYPSDRGKQDIDETHAMVGKVVDVVETISRSHPGRIRFGETTWKAICKDESVFALGDKVQIVGRDNITWVVTKVEGDR